MLKCNKQIKQITIEFDDLVTRMKDMGINVVATISYYDYKGALADFDTIISLVDGNQDHIVLDSIREIIQQWSDSAHITTNG